jgi:hypothetical protein
MKFGVLYDFRPWPAFYAGALDHMQEMERPGFEALSLAEHHRDPEGYNPGSLVTLTAALRTQRSRIGSNIIVLPCSASPACGRQRGALRGTLVQGLAREDLARDRERAGSVIGVATRGKCSSRRRPRGAYCVSLLLARLSLKQFLFFSRRVQIASLFAASRSSSRLWRRSVSSYAKARVTAQHESQISPKPRKQYSFTTPLPCNLLLHVIIPSPTAFHWEFNHNKALSPRHEFSFFWTTGGAPKKKRDYAKADTTSRPPLSQWEER